MTSPLAALRFSLAELLVVALFAGLGLASLRVGGLLAGTVFLMAILLFAGTLVTAILGRRESRAFAVGFLVGAMLYGGVVHWLSESEYAFERGRLATTRLAEPLFDVMASRAYSDASGRIPPTLEEIAVADRQSTTTFFEPDGLGAMVAYDGVWAAGKLFRVTHEPSESEFLAIVHLLVALLAGFVVGKFAVAVFLRRDAAETPVERTDATG